VPARIQYSHQTLQLLADRMCSDAEAAYVEASQQGWCDGKSPEDIERDLHEHERVRKAVQGDVALQIRRRLERIVAISTIQGALRGWKVRHLHDGHLERRRQECRILDGMIDEVSRTVLQRAAQKDAAKMHAATKRAAFTMGDGAHEDVQGPESNEDVGGNEHGGMVHNGGTSQSMSGVIAPFTETTSPAATETTSPAATETTSHSSRESEAPRRSPTANGVANSEHALEVKQPCVGDLSVGEQIIHPVGGGSKLQRLVKKSLKDTRKSRKLCDYVTREYDKTMAACVLQALLHAHHARRFVRSHSGGITGGSVGEKADRDEVVKGVVSDAVWLDRTAMDDCELRAALVTDMEETVGAALVTDMEETAGIRQHTVHPVVRTKREETAADAGERRRRNSRKKSIGRVWHS